MATAAVVALLAAAGASPAGQTGPAAGTPIVIRNATVLTVTGGTIPNGSVLVRDGRIAAVGPDVEAPPGAHEIDGSGRFVTPGLIDAHSHIAADSINEGGTTVSSMTGIEDVLDPSDINIYRDLAGGLTTANILHGSANPIGGKNAVIKLRWGKARAGELLFEGAMPGIKFALGENPKDMSSDEDEPRRYPVTRPGVEYVIRDAFTRAKAYQRAWQAYERRRAAGEDPAPPRRNLQLEPLVEILEGKRLVHAHCYRADEILMLIRLAEELGFKIATFQHVLEGYKVAREIAAHGAGASTFSDWWGYKVEAVDAIPHNAALMTAKGVVVSINSDSAEHARRLNTEAAKSIKWGGLTEDQALALVTINPARQLRIDDRVGSIEVGKDADLAVWTHHPLSTYARVDYTLVDGIIYYDRRAEERRLTELRKEKDSLLAADEADRRAPTTDDEAEPPSRARTTSADAGEPRTVAGGTNGRDGGAGGTTGAPVASAARPAPAQTPPADGRVLAITNARIHPITQPTIDRGIIVIRGDRIEAVGAEAAVPAGAEVIDAQGADVYPGWINARSTLGLAEPGPRGFQDTEEMLDFNPQLRTIVAYHADSQAIPVARANGVTAAAITPSGGVLGGQIALVKLDGWTWEEATIEDVVGIAFQFPTIQPPRRFGAQGAEQTYEELVEERDEKLKEVARLIDQARAYARAAGPDRPTDWTLEALVPVAERQLPLITRVDREADIRAAVAFADRVGVRMIVSGGLEAPLVAPLLAEKDIPVILGSILTLPTREDMPHAATYRAAGELAAAGVTFAFATGDHTNARLLPYHAAQSVAWGLDRDRALRALTIDAARILGVDDRLGSLEPGTLANLVVVEGDPLEIRSPVRHVIIAGRDVGLANRQQALYERYLARP